MPAQGDCVKCQISAEALAQVHISSVSVFFSVFPRNANCNDVHIVIKKANNEECSAILNHNMLSSADI